jgi:hypothetical protein
VFADTDARLFSPDVTFSGIWLNNAEAERFGH